MSEEKKKKTWLDKKVLKFKQKWEARTDEQKERIVYWLNYAVNAIPISFLIYCLFSIKLNHSFIRMIATYLSTFVFLVYYEYYYIWHKETWKDNVPIKTEEEKRREKFINDKNYRHN